MSFSPRSHHTYVRFFAFRVPNLGGVFLWKYKCSSPFNALEFLLNLKFSGISHFICIGWKWVLMHLQIIWKSCCFVYNVHLFYTYIYILEMWKPPFYLEYVDKASTELGIEVQVEQVRLVLLLFQNLTALN